VLEACQLFVPHKGTELAKKKKKKNWPEAIVSLLKDVSKEVPFSWVTREVVLFVTILFYPNTVTK
jgi:hypothetical protein